MRKSAFSKIMLPLLALLLLCAPKAKAEGEYAWPANYDGVMLQGFYWDSYKDSKWTVLKANAAELSSYFNLIWVPNAGKSSANPSMGYDPVYWFSNFNSSFGNEAELRSMISTFKQFGTGIIEDVVVNHRNGATNWYDFPAETYNGKLTNSVLTPSARTTSLPTRLVCRSLPAHTTPATTLTAAATLTTQILQCRRR